MAINLRFSAMIGIVFGAAMMRLLPHAPNFTPLAAIALFGGAHFDRRFAAFGVPLAAMLLSDIVLELLFGWGLHEQIPVVYASFLAITAVGRLLRERGLPVALGTAALVSLAFFLTTNFSVWATGRFYPLTATGLIACFEAALPLYGPQLAGDVFYTALLFGAWELARRRFAALAVVPSGAQ